MEATTESNIVIFEGTEETTVNLDEAIDESNINTDIDLEEPNINSDVDITETNLDADIDVVETNIITGRDIAETNVDAGVDEIDSNINADGDIAEANIDADVNVVETNIDADQCAAETSMKEDKEPEETSVGIEEEATEENIKAFLESTETNFKVDEEKHWSVIRRSLFELIKDGSKNRIGLTSNNNPYGANVIFRCKDRKSVAAHESILKPNCSFFETLSGSSERNDFYDPNGRLYISIPDVRLNILIECLEIIYLGKTNISLSNYNNSDDIDEIKFVLDEIFHIKWDLFNDVKDNETNKKEKVKKEDKKEETPRSMIRNILKDVTEEAMSASDNEASQADLLLDRFVKELENSENDSDGKETENEDQANEDDDEETQNEASKGNQSRKKDLLDMRMNNKYKYDIDINDGMEDIDTEDEMENHVKLDNGANSSPTKGKIMNGVDDLLAKLDQIENRFSEKEDPLDQKDEKTDGKLDEIDEEFGLNLGSDLIKKEIDEEFSMDKELSDDDKKEIKKERPKTRKSAKKMKRDPDKMDEVDQILREVKGKEEERKVKEEESEWCAVCHNIGDNADEISYGCDSCPKLYHPSCYTPPITEKPEGHWTCIRCLTVDDIEAIPDKIDDESESVLPDQEDEGGEQVSTQKKEPNLNPRDLKIAQRLLLEMLGRYPEVTTFSCIEDLDFPLYKEVIDSPVALDTIKSRVDRSAGYISHHDKYQSLYEFVYDVRCMFTNCRTFWLGRGKRKGKGTLYVQHSYNMEGTFDRALYGLTRLIKEDLPPKVEVDTERFQEPPKQGRPPKNKPGQGIWGGRWAWQSPNSSSAEYEIENSERRNLKSDLGNLKRSPPKKRKRHRTMSVDLGEFVDSRFGQLLPKKQKPQKPRYTGPPRPPGRPKKKRDECHGGCDEHCKHSDESNPDEHVKLNQVDRKYRAPKPRGNEQTNLTNENVQNLPKTYTDEIRRCKFCTEMFDDIRRLRNHTLIHFKEELLQVVPADPPFTCPACEAEFPQRLPLIQHFAFKHHCTEEELNGDFVMKRKKVPKPGYPPSKPGYPPKPNQIPNPHAKMANQISSIIAQNNNNKIKMNKTKGVRAPRGPYKKTIQKNQGLPPGGVPIMNQLPIQMVNGLAEMIRPPPNSKLPAGNMMGENKAGPQAMLPSGIRVKNVTSLNSPNMLAMKNEKAPIEGPRRSLDPLSVPSFKDSSVDSDASTDVDEDKISKYMESKDSEVPKAPPTGDVVKNILKGAGDMNGIPRKESSENADSDSYPEIPMS